MSMNFIHEKLITSKEILQNALSNKYAVGAFNFSNMEILQAIVEANNEMNSPFILQVSESAIKYMGMEYLLVLASAAATMSMVPLCLHLDHGKDFEICKTCIDAGFSSVMIDKSSLSFEENVEKTKEVVEYAHKRGVSVEAELGTLSGIEDYVNVSEQNAVLTDPESAKRFVDVTGVDSLAVAIGTSHGPNKGKTSSPKLDIDRLKHIRALLGSDYPIVLHGASSVYADIVEKCNSFGADIKNAFGISKDDIRNSIENGVAKINVDTDIRLAFLAGIRESMHDSPSNIDPRKYFTNAKNEAKDVIKRKISEFYY